MSMSGSNIPPKNEAKDKEEEKKKKRRPMLLPIFIDTFKNKLSSRIKSDILSYGGTLQTSDNSSDNAFLNVVASSGEAAVSLIPFAGPTLSDYVAPAVTSIHETITGDKKAKKIKNVVSIFGADDQKINDFVQILLDTIALLYGEFINKLSNKDAEKLADASANLAMKYIREHASESKTIAELIKRIAQKFAEKYLWEETNEKNESIISIELKGKYKFSEGSAEVGPVQEQVGNRLSELDVMSFFVANPTIVDEINHQLRLKERNRIQLESKVEILEREVAEAKEREAKKDEIILRLQRDMENLKQTTAITLSEMLQRIEKLEGNRNTNQTIESPPPPTQRIESPPPTSNRHRSAAQSFSITNIFNRKPEEPTTLPSSTSTKHKK